MVGWSFFNEEYQFGLSLLVGFFGLLRTGELFDVDASSIYMTGPSQGAVISLGLTKGAKRTGAAESVTLYVKEVLKKLWQWKQVARQHEPLVPSSSRWRKLFSRCIDELHLSSFGFRPYSLRRGGATFWFHRHGSFDKLLILGRWQASRTARIYLNEGLAMLAEMTMPKAHLTPFVKVYNSVVRQSWPKLEQTLGSWTGGRG